MRDTWHPHTAAASADAAAAAAAAVESLHPACVRMQVRAVPSSNIARTKQVRSAIARNCASFLMTWKRSYAGIGHHRHQSSSSSSYLVKGYQKG